MTRNARRTCAALLLLFFTLPSAARADDTAPAPPDRALINVRVAEPDTLLPPDRALINVRVAEPDTLLPPDRALINVRVAGPDTLQPPDWALINVRVAEPDTLQPTFRPLLGLRVRQETLRGVFHFDPENQDRDWIRFRSRAGLRWRPAAGHRLELRLLNEFRKFLDPDTEIDFDEIVVDQLLWCRSWYRRSGHYSLKIGRQDIIWYRGFLIFEGHPYDGSRSMYQNAVRLRAHRAQRGELELVGIFNPKRDPFVLAGDEDRALADADETALALRLEQAPGGNHLVLIWKREDDPDAERPDLDTWTLAFRRSEQVFWFSGKMFWELALQRQSGELREGWALALHCEAEKRFNSATSLEGGFFYYSGENGALEPFRTPYGRWPKWSELYIYTLIPEGGVAAWQNIAAPHVTLRRNIGTHGHPDVTRNAQFRLSGYLLYAPEPDWEPRGSLLEAELRFGLAKGLTGHLLWEMLAPGAFHDDIEDSVHFLRWQLNYEIK